MKSVYLMIGTIMGALLARAAMQSPACPATEPIITRCLVDLLVCFFKWGGLLTAMACFKAWWRL